MGRIKTPRTIEAERVAGLLNVSYSQARSLISGRSTYSPKQLAILNTSTGGYLTELVSKGYAAHSLAEATLIELGIDSLLDLAELLAFIKHHK